MTESPNAIEAFLTTLKSLPADAPTACGGWTAHEVAAHLAAGVEEVTELIEDRVNDAPARPTRGFGEREAPYRVMVDTDVREALAKMVDRAFTAVGAQAEKGVTVEFFERLWTADEFGMHTGNEFAVHRWDLIGDDELGDTFLSPLPVTESAVTTLNTLPVLEEAPTARARRGRLADARVVLRSQGQPDIVLTVAPDGGARLEIGGDEPLTGDVVVSTDAVNRLLTLWGRRSSVRPVTVTGDPALWPAVAATLWGDAPAWAPRRG
jgi:Mycothiol maleylpyruvate isomerase N-terminal domain/MDMPI C-terminal domain